MNYSPLYCFDIKQASGLLNNLAHSLVISVRIWNNQIAAATAVSLIYYE